MKFNIYNFSAVILATTILLASCSKELIDNKKQSSENPDQTTQKLINFKQDLFSKSGGSMPSDSAEWHLEGLLNYEQANNTHDFIQVEFLYDTLTWPASNGVVSYEGLQQLYASVNELAQSMVLQNGNPDYTFNVIDLEVIESSLKSGDQSLVVTLSGGLLGTIPTYMPFGPTDYWKSGGLQGKCDGQYIGRDATTELEHHFKSPYTIPSYFVSPISFHVYYAENEATDNPFGYYMMWFEMGNGSNNCLSPDELNYYLSKWDYLKNKYKPDGKTFCSVDVIYDNILGAKGTHAHTYYMTYGVNIGSNPN